MTDDARGTGGQVPSGPQGVDDSLTGQTPDPPPRADPAVASARRQSLSRVALAAGFALGFTALGMVIQHTLEDSRLVTVSAPASGGGGSPGSTVPSLEPLTATEPRATVTSAPPEAPSPTVGARPAAAVAVHIPRLKLDRSLISLHVLPDGSMSVPQNANDVGWWAEGPHPGADGATLVAGHVDSKAGPAVFYRLKELQPGDLVTVDRSDHTTAVFTVVDKVTYTRADFPDDVVYRVTGKPSLHLVTCDGFDPAIGHYGANLVVSAELVSSGPTGGQG